MTQTTPSSSLWTPATLQLVSSSLKEMTKVARDQPVMDLYLSTKERPGIPNPSLNSMVFSERLELFDYTLLVSNTSKLKLMPSTLKECLTNLTYNPMPLSTDGSKVSSSLTLNLCMSQPTNTKDLMPFQGKIWG